MDPKFEVASCHGDHAGNAYVTVKHVRVGAEVAVQHVPFDADAGESVAEEQARILGKAARIAREAAAFLEAEAKLACGWPTQASAPGASPREGEPPNAFGQPVPRA